MAIRVNNPGFLTTVQDRGRYGYAHLGISPAGAADQLSFRISNLLVGSDENSPALEMTMSGVTLELEERAVIAITGGDCECKVGSYSVASATALEVPAGAVVRCGAMRSGVRSYLAIQGGFDVPPVMGSASTHIAGRFGGFHGRRLKAGDVLHVGKQRTSRMRTLKPGALDHLYRPAPIRVTRGAQQEWFGPESFEKLFSCPYTVGEQSDRTGLRLKGETVRPRVESQLLTDGIPLGAVQVPQDGQPIILFVDQQTTGGYPKIASVIASDRHRVGQVKPRDKVRFSEVSITEAIRLLREQEAWLQQTFAT
jgi:antagonist of KipI